MANGSSNIRRLEIVFTAAVLLLGLLTGLGFFFAPLKALLHPLLSAYLLALEVFFRLAETNELILAVSGAVLVMGLFSRLLLALASMLPGLAGRAAQAALGGFLATLALLAQVYVLAFAAITQPAYLALVLALGVAAGLYWRRRTRSAGTDTDASGDAAGSKDPLARVPVTVLLSFLVIYFFLGMIQGHLATPLVYTLSATMAHLSANQPVVFRLLAVLALGLPLLPWLPKLLRALPAGRMRKMVPAGGLVLVCALSLLPSRPAIYTGGALWAAALGLGLAAAGFSPLSLLHPDPRRLLTRVLLVSLLGVNAATVHYLATMWECDHAPHPAVRRVSAEAGAFSMTTSADGRRLLVSLREPQRLVSVDLARGETDTLLSLAGGEGTGHLFSWQEPENLLRLDDGRFLLLRAVSDDQEHNTVAVLDQAGKVAQLLTRPRAGVSDMVSDGAGRIYLSTEFQGQVFVLDARTLALQDTVRWPDAETNRVLVDPNRRRIYSLGLWSDPMLRVMDLSSRTEIGAVDVGTLSWDMAHDPGRKKVFVPKFMTGRVLVIDDQKLTVQHRWPAGFGARTVRLDTKLGLLYVGAMYAGTVTVLHADTGERLLSLRLGGHIKGLHLEPGTHKVYVGCDCGIFEIDGNKIVTGRGDEAMRVR